MVWEKNYKRGRYNNYPYDKVVSIVLTIFKNRAARKKIKILDLGPGGGGNTKFLYDEGFNVWAVDESRLAINITKKKIKDKKTKKQIIKGKFESLPFKTNFFDFILDRESLNHNLKKNILKSALEINRSLKKGGYFLTFLFSTKHPEMKYGKRIKKAHKHDLHAFKKGIFKNSGITHFFSLNEIKSIFKEFRFIEIIKERSDPIMKRFTKYNNNSFVILLQKK